MTPPKQTDQKEVPAKAKGKQILIVEDERPLAHALELKFRHEGFEPHIAMDGEEALKEAGGGTYDVILLDLIMPRMDGFMFMQEMKSKGVHTPTIVLSNLGQDEDKTRAKELGAAAYYVKSNTPIMEIVKQVQSILSK
ncbi:MAG: response regulator [Candidatus Peribacteraceae bacterium]|nr:response regulator [Candidatus Peribacteraceae bacterium]MDD5074875.1 response regulator [Candidatus Peribacteraceae bacterium]